MTTREPKRTKRPKKGGSTIRIDQKAATRAKIIAVAQKMFHHAGYEAVKMRDVAAQAGTSTGAIFSSFPDKAGLFEAAMNEPPPNVQSWLEMVTITSDRDDLTPAVALSLLRMLGAQARHLRHRLIGHHG